MERYIAVMDLKKNYALFPKNMRKGANLVAATYAVMYQALEGVKEKLGLEKNLTWHWFCLALGTGSATRGTVLGVTRSVVKGAGQWRSGCVDSGGGSRDVPQSGLGG